MAKEYDQWQAQDDASTLAKAEAIKSDKKRHGQVQEHVKRINAAVNGAAPKTTPKAKPSASKRGGK